MPCFCDAAKFNERFLLTSYLVSFVFWITIALGAMFFVLISYVMNATWSVVLRRIAENLMKTLPLMFFLLVILVRSIFTAMMKMNGEIISPWSTPCLSRNFREISPLAGMYTKLKALIVKSFLEIY